MQIKQKIKDNRDFILFLAASAILGISQSVEGAAFNNFLNDAFQISVMQRTLIEIPRELPGFLVVFVSAALLFLGDRRMAVVANLTAGVGFLMIGLFSTTLGMAVFWIFIFSSGQHLMMPLTQSIGMSFSDNQGIGRRLGMLGSVTTGVFLLTSITTFFIFRGVDLSRQQYSWLFGVGAAAMILAAVCISFMSRPVSKKNETEKRKRFFFRKEYKLYYFLRIVFGARKQIFITFGPWVLIKVFEQGVSTFALLGFAVAGVGMLFKPLVGYFIDKRGERFVLMGDAILLVMVCMGYGFAEIITYRLGLPPGLALGVVCGCFVVDQLLTGTTIAHATYLRKIAVREDDVQLTLSMGISLDHAVSMIIPFFGAFLWNAMGYSLVFLGGAIIAVVNLLIARRLNT